LMSTTLVSTGLDPNLTEQGLFRIRLKYPKQDLGGFTDATGEVLGFGDAPPGTIPYQVKDVPHVMYFNLDAEALHGTYWHTNFGQKMSHGCVNLPLDVAKWMYGWAPLGTGVWVHE
ncbi:MAG: L,D-transpeptidase, partial [Chloroflexota bacterium]|nr:L,D-transpeptidase [Chloroflexota bacterium]